MAQQSVMVNTFGVSPRDVAEDETTFFDTAYNGLDNVGIGTKIFLKGTGGLAFTAATWALTSAPLTSATTMGTTLVGDTNVVYANFTPDIAGKYVITFTDGAATATMTFNAGTYLGLEEGNCVLCHSSYVEKWAETGHSDIMTRAMEGTLSDHYAAYCLPCHTTGYDPAAANMGFDDRDFVYPAELTTGVFDALKTTSPSAMKLANIQCESCHGPALGHGGAVSMSTNVDTDVCAWCHDSGTHHAFPEQWDHSGHDATEFDGRGFHGGHAVGAFVESAGGRKGCADCHSGAGFIAWVKNGNVSPDEVATPTNIGCATCHDPHDNTNAFQLRMVETTLGDGTEVTFDQYGTGVICMNCHKSRREAATYAENPDNASSHFGAHHGPEADMLLGVNAPNFGVKIPTSPHAVAIENACVGCHMYGNDHVADADGNIVVVGGHSFNMNDAEGNDNVHACEPCHGDIGESFAEKKFYINGNADLDNDGTAEGLQHEVHGLMTYLATFLPKDANGTVLLVKGDPAVTVEVTKAAYVYFWVEEDRSFGVHNPAFTVGLLKAAIESLGGVTAIEYEEDMVPTEYRMSQNYPNPFNPTTNIKFSVPATSNVRITVYDALGKEVARLLDSEMSAGSHQVTWNATNLASGIYFSRMEAGDFVTIKKMLLMK